ncbi:periplasmic heavy metal sensor [Poseidonocella sp. HB161398]|uniref:periplasmic heavy metal sensor n=1 Tax=Poseidonocella sp. HB161398 TaxID=2320855 RepID=UPI001107EA96|nr:periplasmic heavy metal sensor [Poseidonocella sp. HB161398]
MAPLARRLRPGRLGLLLLLAVSLTANAVTLGAALRVRQLKTELLGDAGSAAFYPPEVRRALRRAMEENRDEILPALHAVAAARAEVVAAGTAEPFDRAATEAAMAAFRASIDALLVTSQAAALDALEEQAPGG